MKIRDAVESYDFGADLPGIRLSEAFESFPEEIRKDPTAKRVAALWGGGRVEDLIREKSRVIASLTAAKNIAAMRNIYRELESVI